jgi:hypothetical protein
MVLAEPRDMLPDTQSGIDNTGNLPKHLHSESTALPPSRQVAPGVRTPGRTPADRHGTPARGAFPVSIDRILIRRPRQAPPEPGGCFAALPNGVYVKGPFYFKTY